MIVVHSKVMATTRSDVMGSRSALALAAFIALCGTAALAQTSSVLQNPGVSTTPGVTQPTSPNATGSFQSIQNTPLSGPNTQPNQANGNNLSPLGFSSINVVAPQVQPRAFGSANVLSTVSPRATVAQPALSVGTPTTTTNSITPASASFTFTPSQQFSGIITPRPFVQPSQRRR